MSCPPRRRVNWCRGCVDGVPVVSEAHQQMLPQGLAFACELTRLARALNLDGYADSKVVVTEDGPRTLTVL